MLPKFELVVDMVCELSIIAGEIFAENMIDLIILIQSLALLSLKRDKCVVCRLSDYGSVGRTT